MAQDPHFKTQDDDRGQALSDYWPLASLMVVAALAGVAICLRTDGDLMTGMAAFMGVFLCIFALLKLFHPSAFADGFAMYDLLAKRWRGYGYVYPIIELTLGLGFLSGLYPLWVTGATVVVMTFGALGVVSALRQGLDINCPCMGSVLDVPLSTVTLTEDLGMGAMALVMLLVHLS